MQYLNNILEQDHRAIKRRVNAKQGFREFQAAQRTIQGYEAVHMIRKGQARWVAGDDLLRQIQFIDSFFELAAKPPGSPCGLALFPVSHPCAARPAPASRPVRLGFGLSPY